MDNGMNNGDDMTLDGMQTRLGFAVKVLGEIGLKSNDSRRWQSNPHLRVSLEYLHGIFDYLAKRDIHMYRMSSDVAPYATHPDLPQFHNQVSDARNELAAFGKRSRELDIRLSFHPSQYIVMNTPDPKIRDKSIWDLRVQAEMLDAMELNQDAVMIIHVGGTYGDPKSALERWVTCYGLLPEPAKRRLVLENDDIRFSAADVLWVHEQTGVRLAFDVQHHQCLNPNGLALLPTFERFLRTWPEGTKPKMHFSSPRTEMRPVTRKNRKTGKKETVLQPPIWTGHADYIHPFDFLRFAAETNHLRFDIMLEAKAKDLALLRLRRDITTYAPELSERFGIAKAEEPVPEVEIPAEELVGE